MERAHLKLGASTAIRQGIMQARPFRPRPRSGCRRGLPGYQVQELCFVHCSRHRSASKLPDGKPYVQGSHCPFTRVSFQLSLLTAEDSYTVGHSKFSNTNTFQDCGGRTPSGCFGEASAMPRAMQGPTTWKLPTALAY